MTNKRALSWSATLRDLHDVRRHRASVREERLRATVGLRGDTSRLTSWRGHSGRRYVVGVHPLAGPDVADVTEAVMIAVHRDPDGKAAVLDATTPGRDISRRTRLRWLSTMRARGATEMHVHLLAAGDDERAAVAADLLGERGSSTAGKQND